MFLLNYSNNLNTVLRLIKVMYEIRLIWLLGGLKNPTFLEFGHSVKFQTTNYFNPKY
jgi:hypothetical protein